MIYPRYSSKFQMKLLTKTLIAALIGLVLLEPPPSNAAERKLRRKRSPRDDSSSTTPSTPSTPSAPSTLPAPATGIPASPTAPIQINVVRPRQGEELTISSGGTFVIGTLPNDTYSLRCNIRGVRANPKSRPTPNGRGEDDGCHF
jgi:hypothetical protein